MSSLENEKTQLITGLKKNEQSFSDLIYPLETDALQTTVTENIIDDSENISEVIPEPKDAYNQSIDPDKTQLITPAVSQPINFLADAETVELSSATDQTSQTDAHSTLSTEPLTADQTQLINRAASHPINLQADAEISPPSSHADQTLLMDVSSPINSASVLPNDLPPQTPHAGLGVGDILNGRFELVDKVGDGGMGMVFKAIDHLSVANKASNPYVAIKVLDPELAAQNPMMVPALYKECERARSLRHPNIISVYDFGNDGNYFFISMELLTGQSLKQIIKDAQPAGGIKLQKAWPLIRQMAQALSYAHKRNIVHRDFKPANVIVSDDGEVKILDFGIAANIEAASSGYDSQQSSSQDSPTVLMRAGFTPPYASLEMFLYQHHQPDPRDDVYAFGLVVYEILTGRHPYDRLSASEVFTSKQQKEPKPVKGLNRRQWRALKSTIQLQQINRPENLDEWLEKFNPDTRKLPIILIGGFVALIATIGALWFSNMPPPQPPIFTPPTAKINGPTQVQIGEPIILSGIESKTGDGSAINYSWRFLQLPEGSGSTLQNTDQAYAQFMPDKPGVYKFELLVSDKHATTHAEFETSVQTKPILPPPPVAATQLPQEKPFSMHASKEVYKIGDDLKVSVHIGHKSNGYLRVAYLSASGEMSEILPNTFQPSSVKADSDIQLPPKSGKYKLQIGGPVGVDRIVAVFSESPLPDVENIIDSKGVVAPEFQKEGVFSETIQYDVIK